MSLFAGYGRTAMLRTDGIATQRAVVGLVLERERELAGLERLLGSGAVDAVKVLAADSVVIRHGERLWASPCLSRLEALGLVVASDGDARPEADSRGVGQPQARREARRSRSPSLGKIGSAVDARYKSMMVAVVPQPRQMPPPPFDKSALQGIFATVTESYPYQGFGFTPNGRGAQFGNGPDDFVELRPALLRVEVKMDGPELLLADMAQEKVLRILNIAIDGLNIEALLQCAVQIWASADAPGGDAKAFVAESLMHGGQQAAKLGDNYFGAAVRFRDLREDGRPDEDELSIEPDVTNNRLLFLDHKMARFAVTGPIGLGDVSTWLSEAFSFVDGPTMDLLEKAEGDNDPH